MMKRATSALFVLALLGPAWAHYLWLNAGDYTPRALGTKRRAVIFVSLGWGHRFPLAGFLPDGDVKELFVLGPSGHVGFERSSAVEYQSKRALPEGTYLVVASRRPSFHTKTAHGHVRGPKTGLKDVIKCSFSSMFAKAVVQVGETLNEVSRPVGQALEIVPLRNPYALRQGEVLPVKVLFEGKPLRTWVMATYEGFSADPDTFAYATRADAQGVARIRLLRSGVWMVKASHEVPYPDRTRCDVRKYVATLTFEVP